MTDASGSAGNVGLRARDAIGTVIVGGGVIGLCVAVFLARDGLDVAILDSGQVGGSTTNAGSLHVQMQPRFMRSNPDKVPALMRSLHLYPRAVAFWRLLESELGADFEIVLAGGLTLAETSQHMRYLADKCANERKFGLDVELLDRAELRRVAPYLDPAVLGAQFCRNEGKVNPLRANAGLRKAAAELGVAIIDGETVRSITPEPQGFKLSTDSRTLKCGRLVVAGGARSQALLRPLGVALSGGPSALHMSVTEAVAPLIPHLVQHSELPLTLKQQSTGQILIGGGWPAQMPDRATVAGVRLDSMVGSAVLATRLVPEISSARIIRCWGGVNTTVDGMSVLGEVDTVPGLFLALPGFAGYTLAPLLARLVADCILGRKPSEDISVFSPSRFGPA